MVVVKENHEDREGENQGENQLALQGENQLATTFDHLPPPSQQLLDKLGNM